VFWLKVLKIVALSAAQDNSLSFPSDFTKLISKILELWSSIVPISS